MPSPIYQGDLPYAFVSYAHKDQATVDLMLETMTQVGVRLWYDVGIHAGSDWYDEIAVKLSKSSLCVVMLSKSYVQSEHCIQELAYAITNKLLPVLAIYLEPVELPEGLQMYLSGRQAVNLEEFSDDASFYEKLFDAELWTPCRVDGSSLDALQLAKGKRKLAKSRKQFPTWQYVSVVVFALLALTMAFSSYMSQRRQQLEQTRIVQQGETLYQQGLEQYCGLNAVKVDRAAGYKALQESTQLGNLSAQAMLAYITITDGEPKHAPDVQRAYELAQLPAQKHEPLAMITQAIYFDDPRKGYYDSYKAQALYNEAVNVTAMSLQKDVNTRALLIMAKLFDPEQSPIDAFEVDSLISTRYLQRASNLGDPKAMSMYGWTLISHDEPKRSSPQEGLKLIQTAIQLEEPEAFYYYGMCYQDGKGVERDESKAQQLYEQGAKLGSIKCVYMLSSCYAKGAGGNKDKLRAFELTNDAYFYNDPDVIAQLANYYSDGIGCKVDKERAVTLYREAAELGSVGAMSALAYCYENGMGVEQDSVASFLWSKRAAEKGWPAACYNLAVDYYSGLGVRQDYDKALKYFKKAHDAGIEEADNYLDKYKEKESPQNVYWKGIISYFGIYGHTIDLSDGFHKLQHASDLGSLDAKSTLAWIYAQGKTITEEKNLELAYRLASETPLYPASQEALALCALAKDDWQEHRRASVLLLDALHGYEQDEQAGDELAGFFLANLISEKERPELYDPERAAKLLERCADSELGVAKFLLGLEVYADEENSRYDLQMAAESIQSAAEQNDRIALLYLGRAYMSGLGVEVDYDRAIEYYKKSAQARYLPAMSQLASCYLNGIGVEKDQVQGLAWYIRASMAGAKSVASTLSQKRGTKAYADALYEVGKEQLFGLSGQTVDRRAAIATLRDGYHRGNLQAQGLLATLIFDGAGVQDAQPEEAIELALEPARQGVEYAQILLARASQLHYDVKLQEDELHRLTDQAIKNLQDAAQQGDALASAQLAECYYLGVGVERDLQRCAQLYEDAANQGLALAKYKLGLLFEMEPELHDRWRESLTLYLSAADSDLPEALCKLGHYYYFHAGYPTKERAMNYFQRAEQTGYKGVSSYVAILALLSILKNDELTDDLDSQVNESIQKAKENNDSLATLALGVRKLEGLDEDFNPDQGYQALEKSAAQGNLLATYYLGQCYEKGDGVPRNHKQAFELYTQTLEKYKQERPIAPLEYDAATSTLIENMGISAITYALGRCYQLGRGVEKDVETAHEYYQRVLDDYPGSWVEELAREGLKQPRSGYFEQ